MRLAILVKPSELVCILIPLFWNISNKKNLAQKLVLLKSNFRHIILMIFAVFVVGLPQLLYWKYSSGHWLFYSYKNPGEGFDIGQPYIKEILFSFRKGWLIYTPVMLFAVAGFVSLYKQKKALFYSILVYFLVNLCIVTSWTCWRYVGRSYSQRALLSSYVLLAIPLGYLIQQAQAWKKGLQLLFYSRIGLMLILNLFQTWQWTHRVIDQTRMTKAYYFAIFGKTSTSEADHKLLLIERPTDGIEILKNESDYTRRTAAVFDFENSSEQGLLLS
jgi:hypothetical protein